MNFQNILLEEKGSVAIVTINRPDKLNALNAVLISELETVFSYLGEKEDIRVVMLTGSGEKAFVAGADISEINSLDMISGKEFAEKGQAVFNLIENLNKPVIAAVNGFALGGGCELALACHFRIASENAKFGLPEVNLGIIPGYGGTQRLPRVIGTGKATEYILTGYYIDADEAMKTGLVNHVFQLNDLLPKALEIAAKIAAKPHHAVRLALKAISASNDLGLHKGLSFEAGLFALACGTDDFKEGTSAFLEKRKPNFKHK